MVKCFPMSDQHTFWPIGVWKSLVFVILMIVSCLQMWLSTPVYCCTLVKINTMLVTPICPVLVFRAIQAIGTSLCIGNPVVVVYGSVTDQVSSAGFQAHCEMLHFLGHFESHAVILFLHSLETRCCLCSCASGQHHVPLSVFLALQPSRKCKAFLEYHAWFFAANIWSLFFSILHSL